MVAACVLTRVCCCLFSCTLTMTPPQGGIVSPSWQTFMWVKLRYLQDKMGLRPWYL